MQEIGELLAIAAFSIVGQLAFVQWAGGSRSRAVLLGQPSMPATESWQHGYEIVLIASAAALGCRRAIHPGCVRRRPAPAVWCGTRKWCDALDVMGGRRERQYLGQTAAWCTVPQPSIATVYPPLRGDTKKADHLDRPDCSDTYAET